MVVDQGDMTELVARCYSAATTHRQMRQARERYGYRRREMSHGGRREASPEAVLPPEQAIIGEDVCGVVGHSSAMSDLSPAEWHWLDLWHSEAEDLFMFFASAMPHLPLESRQALLGGAALPRGASQVALEEAELISAVLAFIRSFKGPAQRRRILHVMLALNETGVEVRAGRTPDGEPYGDLQTGLHAGYVKSVA